MEKAICEQSQVSGKSVVNFETQKARLQRQISEMQSLKLDAVWRGNELDYVESLKQSILSRQNKLADLEAGN